jgi:hypothetical protein
MRPARPGYSVLPRNYWAIITKAVATALSGPPLVRSGPTRDAACPGAAARRSGGSHAPWQV